MHKREGAQEPRCARSEGRCGAVGFYVVVAATTGPRARREFTPLRQLRPPEVLPSRQSRQARHRYFSARGHGRSRLRGEFARMLLAECDPFCALQACRLWPLKTVMLAMGILVSSAGNFNIIHHSGPHEEDDEQGYRWKHWTLSKRFRLRWFRGLGRRECWQHQASSPLVTV